MAVMMQPGLTNLFEREITRFLRAASRRTEGDLFLDRRTSKRYHRTMPLFVKRIDGQATDDMTVTLRDISSTGVGFYGDSGFPVGAVLGVKLFWADPLAPRVPAIVRHTHITQQGVLVGAEFIPLDSRACELLEKSNSTWYG